MDFPVWLQSELNRRGWDQAELARRSGITKAQISRVMVGDRSAGVEFCIAVATALRISRDEVFRARGWLLRTSPSVVPPGTHPRIERVVEQINSLPMEIQETLSETFEGIVKLTVPGLQLENGGLPGTASGRTKIDLLEAALIAHKEMMALPKVTDRMAFLRELAARDREVFDTVEELTSETPRNRGQETPGNGRGAGVA